MCGLGDAIAQVFIEKRELEKYDLHRTVRMTAIGLVFTVREFDVFGNNSHCLVSLSQCITLLYDVLCTVKRVFSSPFVHTTGSSSQGLVFASGQRLRAVKKY